MVPLPCYPLRFQKFVFSKIANLSTQTQDKDRGMDASDATTVLIKCLQDRITSKEKQLDEKQMIIEENIKIIGKLTSNQTEWYGLTRVAVLPHKESPTNLHDNQVVQSNNQRQQNNVKMAPTIVNITADQKTKPSTTNKKGKKKQKEQKEHSTP